MRQAVLDRARERAGDAGDPLGPQVPAHDVAAERQREARLLLPPPAEVHDLLQALVRERELPLVDQEPRGDLAVAHGFLDAVERHRAHRDARRPELERERRRRPRSGRGDRNVAGGDRVTRESASTHHDRSVAVAERRAVRKEEVSVREMGVGVKGDGGDRELARHRAAVQRLDVGELVVEREALGVDASLGERVEHEGVVGVGTVSDGDGVRGDHAGILRLGGRTRLDLRPGRRHNESTVSKILSPGDGTF